MAFLSIPLPIAQLSLATVLRCGQSFRWSIFTPPDPKTPVEYRFCLKDRVVCLRQTSDTLFYRSVFPGPLYDRHEREAETLKWLKDYFQLDIDVVALYKQWSERDPVFAQLQERFKGIRMLRQDPWESLISFICSSNNGIPRITRMVQSLCNQYSPPLLSLPHPFCPTEVHTYHPFPPPSALCGSDVGLKLQSLKFGYRAGYIPRTAKMLVDTHGLGRPHQNNFSEASEIWLRQLRNFSTSAARKELLKFVGVGRKVADCILLMSLDKKEVVPVDTHVYQIALKHYGFMSRGKTMTPQLYEDLNHKFLSIWGDYAGWAHSVLFTADLGSSYGLKPPSSTLPPSNSSSPEEGAEKDPQPLQSVLDPPVTPSASPLKRSSYGLEVLSPSSTLPPSNSSSPEEGRTEKDLQPMQSVLDPPVTPSSPLKRRRDPEPDDHVDLSPAETAELQKLLESAEPWDVDDRVKGNEEKYKRGRSYFPSTWQT